MTTCGSSSSAISPRARITPSSPPASTAKWVALDNRRLALVEDVEMRRVLPLFVLGDDRVEQFVTADECRATAPEPAALGF